MSNFNRFNFEQQIMKCWSLMDGLDTIGEGALEYEWTNDQVANATFGLKEMVQLEMDKLFNMFEDGVRSRKIV